jgi:hypothetical protein
MIAAGACAAVLGLAPGAPAATNQTEYLTGVGAGGVEAYAGAMTGNDGLLKGPVVIDGSMLYATLTGANASPWTVTEVHTGLGSCGLNCYATQAVWTGSYPG